MSDGPKHIKDCMEQAYKFYRHMLKFDIDSIQHQFEIQNTGDASDQLESRKCSDLVDMFETALETARSYEKALTEFEVLDDDYELFPTGSTRNDEKAMKSDGKEEKT